MPEDFKLIEKDGDWHKYAFKDRLFAIAKAPYYKTKWRFGLLGANKEADYGIFPSKKAAQEYIRENYYYILSHEQGE